MSFFKRKQKAPFPSSEAFINPLVAGLVSNHEPTFLSALQQAVSLSDGGDYEGIRAIREAIRIRSGKETVRFYEPSIRVRFGEEAFDRYTQAGAIILTLTKKSALLKDPAFSGDYIAALMFSQESAALQSLVTEIFQLGGSSAGYEFQLLYNELRSSARWKER